MRRIFFMAVLSLIVSSCTPVIRGELMKNASVDLLFSEIKGNPSLYKGKLFVLGGTIVNTRLIEKGTVIEALYIPVDQRGYLKSTETSQGRFLAFLPKEKGLLDPLIYRKERQVTIAGEFSETRKDKIDEMEYIYPVFEIQDIYLWEERPYYMFPSYPYYAPYYSPFYTPYWYDPWWHWWGPYYYPRWW